MGGEDYNVEEIRNEMRKILDTNSKAGNSIQEVAWVETRIPPRHIMETDGGLSNKFEKQPFPQPPQNSNNTGSSKLDIGIDLG